MLIVALVPIVLGVNAMHCFLLVWTMLVSVYGKYQEEEDWHTTDAVANYCRVNLFEFNFIFIRRVFEGIRNVFQSFQLGNNEFPASPNLCLVELGDGGKNVNSMLIPKFFLDYKQNLETLPCFQTKICVWLIIPMILLVMQEI